MVLKLTTFSFRIEEEALMNMESDMELSAAQGIVSSFEGSASFRKEVLHLTMISSKFVSRILYQRALSYHSISDLRILLVSSSGN